MNQAHPSRAIVLFAHGSRDPRWAEPLHQLQAAIEHEATAQGHACTVRQAFLEFMQPTLPEVLDALAAHSADAEAAAIDLLPVFWADGGHVLNDLPRLISEAQARHPGLQVRVLPTLARWPGLLDWLAQGIVLLAPSAQVEVEIEFDADVLAALQASGPDWQKRVNDTMRAAVLGRWVAG